MNNNYTCNIENDFFKIYINDKFHFAIDKRKVVSYQSWIDDRATLEILRILLWNLVFYGKIKYDRKKYIIEFILQDDIITTLEYNEKNKWVEILKLINKMHL